jgi:hypothetical protein
MKMLPKSMIKRFLLLSTVCLSMLTPSAKAVYQDSLVDYYDYYYRATTLPAAYRSVGAASYQVASTINIYLAYAKIVDAEMNASVWGEFINDSYAYYFYAQSWLALYEGNNTRSSYNTGIGDYYYNYGQTQRSNWYSYYNPIISYYYSIFYYQVSVRDAF